MLLITDDFFYGIKHYRSFLLETQVVENLTCCFHEGRYRAGESFFEGREDWFNHKELWRMYQSGQFLHFLALRDDWSELSGWGITGNRDVKVGKSLNTIGEVIYEFTEIFEFLSRLAKNGLYDEGVKVSIELHNTKGRVLTTSGNRILFGEYISDMETIPYERVCSKEEMITEPKELAFDAILHFFERFNWPNIPTETIKNDQENLLNRNI